MRFKFLSLVFSAILIINSNMSPINSFELLKIVQNSVNNCFRAVRYTGITSSVVFGLWTAKRIKDNREVSDVAIPLVLTLVSAGIGYLAWKGEKWTNITTKNKEIEIELPHSNSGVQS